MAKLLRLLIETVQPAGASKMFDGRNKLSTTASVDPAWDGRASSRDRQLGSGTNGRIPRVDPTQIISLTSAGNYVEFVLPDAQHLIRGRLGGEEARLKPFGFVRIHRTKLVNRMRVVPIETRANGDFVAKMDTGDAIAGSRRSREASLT